MSTFDFFFYWIHNKVVQMNCYLFVAGLQLSDKLVALICVQMRR